MSTYANADLAMMRIAALDAIARGELGPDSTARRMEDALRDAGRDDLADEIYAAGCAAADSAKQLLREERRADLGLRLYLGAGADIRRGSEIIAARVLASAAQI